MIHSGESGSWDSQLLTGFAWHSARPSTLVALSASGALACQVKITAQIVVGDLIKRSYMFRRRCTSDCAWTGRRPTGSSPPSEPTSSSRTASGEWECDRLFQTRKNNVVW
jgi:hypothetical protein